ncbi:recombinase family protein [Pseudidiomarina taiwanensis]|uniref:Resolvase n=1 Tax=Pseudidiomarina taiwanensis TaxID=337250 RepID=A0A432ZEU2_9GAMM|nr:recombinase family protein [Pseudidiomarina taiwanensis]RUO76441.1 resolvase [Pseudidiomarina taiwanensis]
MTGQKIAYKRVSTVSQNIDRQLDGMTFDKEFVDYVSGSTKERKQLELLLEHIREGDEVFIHDISRCARNLQHLLEIVREITGKKVKLHFIKENLTFTGDKTNPIEELLLSLLGSVYQFERSMMLERQREGIAKAKLKGKFKGRKPTVNREEILKLLAEGHSMRKVASMTGRSLSTVTRVKASAEQKSS